MQPLLCPGDLCCPGFSHPLLLLLVLFSQNLSHLLLPFIILPLLYAIVNNKPNLRML